MNLAASTSMRPAVQTGGMWWRISLVVCGLLSGCAPTWQNVRKEETIKGPSRAYVAVLPEGWKRAPTDSDVLLITRDGVFLQQISISRYRLSEAFAGEKVTADTPPEQLGQWQLKRFKEDEPDLVRKVSEESKGVLAMFPVANARPLPGSTEKTALRPFQIGGKDAFRLETRSYNSWGLAYTSQAIGFVHEDAYWLVRYMAPSLYYAQRDQHTFEDFVQKLQLKASCTLFCSD